MTKYKYRSIDHKGKIQKGVMDAENIRCVVEALNNNKEYLLCAKKISGAFLFRQRPFKDKDIAFFSRQLHFFLKSGIPLITALQTMDTGNAVSKIFLSAACNEIMAGKSLTQALEISEVFPLFYIRMVEAGEASGGLEEIMIQMAERYEKIAFQKQKLHNALLYPSFVFCLIFLLLVFSTFFVFPRFQALFQIMGEDLPTITRGFIAFSTWAQRNWLVVLLICCSIFILDKCLVKILPQYRLRREQLFMKLPVAGKFKKRVLAAEVAQATGFLLMKGVHIVETFYIVGATLQNSLAQKEMLQAAEKIKAGENMVTVFSQLSFLEPLLISMVATGQETGRMDEMLLQASAYYSAWLDTASAKLHTMLEPILTLIAGIVLGFFALSVMLPSLKMVQIL